MKTNKGQCWHKGCTETHVVPCYLPSYQGPVDYNHADTWLCPQHCQEEGFCWGCGQFWAGIESFDFSSSGLCENCKDESDADMGCCDECDEDDGYPFGWESYETEIRP